MVLAPTDTWSQLYGINQELHKEAEVYWQVVQDTWSTLVPSALKNCYLWEILIFKRQTEVIANTDLIYVVSILIYL